MDIVRMDVTFHLRSDGMTFKPFNQSKLCWRKICEFSVEIVNGKPCPFQLCPLSNYSVWSLSQFQPMRLQYIFMLTNRMPVY